MGHAHVEDKPNVASSSAMWFGLLLIVLILAAVNFIKVSSGSHGHEAAHGDTHHNEATHKEDVADPNKHEKENAVTVPALEGPVVDTTPVATQTAH